MIKYKKGKKDSYVHNCLLIRRDNDPTEVIIFQDHDGVFARLNGYAIIPMEKYAELTKTTYGKSQMDNIKQALAVLELGK